MLNNKEAISLFLSHLGDKENTKDVIKVLQLLEPEIHLTGRLNSFKTQLNSNTKMWDIRSVLSLYSKMFQPSSYLEIGVRRGMSLANVLFFSPNCKAYGFDMWLDGYGGVGNPGPDFVKKEMKKTNHKKEITFISGNSHKTVPDFLSQNPNLNFDLILVDGDHSLKGAINDLENIAQRIKQNGLLVFDDIYDPSTSWLLKAWRTFLDSHKDFKSIVENKDFTGTALAIKEK